MSRTLILCAVAFMAGAFVVTVAAGAALVGSAVGQAMAEWNR